MLAMTDDLPEDEIADIYAILESAKPG